MTSSGITTFNPAISDLTLEIYDRIQIRAPEITPDHMRSAKMSFNLVLSTFSNRGVNLWEIDLQTVSLVQGVATYSVPADTIMILPGTYIRNYSLGTPTDITPTFTTTLNSTTVSVYLPNNGVSVDNYINIIIPVAVGGIILYGFYQVLSVTDSNNFTITATSATSSTTGGVVPYFTTSASSTTITVTLPNHGYLAGQSFVIQVPVLVGGLTLAGTYTIATTSTNSFTFAAASPAGSTDNAYENSGDAQISVQEATQIPIDRIMAPMSRDDYAALPNKPQQGFPTTYWFNRILNPTITLWEVPDGNGPYQLQYYRFKQIQTADAKSGQTLDMPYRFLEAFCSSVAFHLAMKWKPESAEKLETYAEKMWAEAAAEDREMVTLYLSPDVSGYYQA